MTCDCGAETDRQQCVDCELADRYEGEGFEPAATDFEEVFVRADGNSEVYHTDRDCAGLQHTASIQRRAKRFVDARECKLCEGAVSPDWSTFQLATETQTEGWP